MVSVLLPLVAAQDEGERTQWDNSVRYVMNLQVYYMTWMFIFTLHPAVCHKFGMYMMLEPLL